MEYNYNIKDFKWDKADNSFYGEAPHLVCIMTDGNIHPEAFPNQKGQFYIRNYDTGSFRRFCFVKENTFKEMDETENVFIFSDWIFESEDGIKCNIAIN